MTENFDQLLDFSKPFNPELFDALVSKTKMNDSNAVITLTRFKNDEQNFMTIEIILNKCQLKESQLISLNILENLIDKKYFTFSKEIRQSFENTILHFIKEKSQTNDLLLNKFNQIFVKLILKNHYNKKSENLIISLIEISQMNITQAINIFSIFTLLIQEIFVNTHPKTIKTIYLNNLKNDMLNILSFTNTVLEKGQGMEKPLIGNALNFLTIFFESLSEESSGYSILNQNENSLKEKVIITVQTEIIQFLVENMLSLLQSEHTTQSIRSLYTIIKYLQTEYNSIESYNFSTVIGSKFCDFLNLYFGKYQNSKKVFVNSYSDMNEEEKKFLLEAAHLLSVLSFKKNNVNNSVNNSV
ncbi:putative exportin 1, partial [Pseudoloma neurophilia]